ncbi:MAG: hypothetical protein LKJ90_08735 [Faecalibacterium sp.]|jgi:hypothetical protein|nr:hypothetical protein [Faecalibacterium sp.]
MQHISLLAGVRARFNGMRRGEKSLFLILCGLFAAQFCFIAWLNLTQLRYHISTDSSCEFLKVYEMWHQGTLFPQQWVDTTMLHLDAPDLLAACLMPLFHEVFTAFGVANTVISILLVLALAAVLRQLHIGPVPGMFALNLVFCPYLVTFYNDSDLGYFSCLLTSAAYYSVKVLLLLLFLALWLRLRANDVFRPIHWFLLAVLAAGCFLSGLSSGYYLAVFAFLPALLCGAISALQKDTCKELFAKEHLLTAALLVLTVAGKFTASHLLGFASHDSSMMLITLEKLWGNLGSVLAGYLYLLNALPYPNAVSALSLPSIVYLLGLLIAVATFAAGCLCLLQFLRRREDAAALPAVIFVCNLVMLGLIDSTYGSSLYEARYLLVAFLIAVLCLACLLQKAKVPHLTALFFCVVLLLCLVGRDVYGDLVFAHSRSDLSRMDAIAAAAAQADVPVVFFDVDQYEDQVALREIRCYDTGHAYKDLTTNGSSVVLRPEFAQQTGGDALSSGAAFWHWGDSSAYDLADEWDGPILLAAEPETFAALPAGLQAHFTRYACISDDLCLYFSNTNVLGL